MVAESRSAMDSEKREGLNSQMERKIAALTAINSALTVENEDLRSQLEAQLDVADGETAAADLKELQEEFAKRLGVADRSVAELRDERDKLRTEVSAVKTSSAHSEKRVIDLEGKVKELKTELDKLNDEHRQHESNAHRLRYESQAASAELSSCKQRIQTLEASLQKAHEQLLVASADAGSREQELEKELQQVKDRSREEVKEAGLRAQQAQDALESAQEEKDMLAHAAAQQDELLEQLTSLRVALSQAQVDLASKEDELLESRACLDRLVRKQDESRATDTVSAELLSQIDRLSQSLEQAQDDGAQALAELQGKYAAAHRSLEESEDRAGELEGTVKRLQEECAAWADKMATSEAHVRDLEKLLEASQQQAVSAERAAKEQQQAADNAAAAARCEVAELRTELHHTTQLLARTEALLAQSQSDRATLKAHLATHADPPTPTRAASAHPSAAAAVFAQATPPSGAPEGGLPRVPSAANGLQTRSLRLSGAGSVADGDWGFGGVMSRTVSVSDMARADTAPGAAHSRGTAAASTHKLDAAVVEGLQAQCTTVEAERDALHAQLLQAFAERTALTEKEAQIEAAASEHRRLQAHLDIATEMIGEQNARISELEEDIADMKAIFHEQLEEAMAQLNIAKAHTHEASATLPEKTVDDRPQLPESLRE